MPKHDYKCKLSLGRLRCKSPNELINKFDLYSFLLFVCLVYWKTKINKLHRVYVINSCEKKSIIFCNLVAIFLHYFNFNEVKCINLSFFFFSFNRVRLYIFISDSFSRPTKISYYLIEHICDLKIHLYANYWLKRETIYQYILKE